MRIQYCSDLHLEFEENSKYLYINPLNIVGEVLILAGDIVPFRDDFLLHPFFTYISENFKKVFWVPGNHEFYYKDIGEYKDSYNILYKQNIHIVHNTSIIYNSIRFVFSSLWSNIADENARTIEQKISDFQYINVHNKRFNTAYFNELHTKSKLFLHEELVKKHNKTVVVTHHLPTPLCNSQTHANSPLNEAFCVDLTELVEQSNASFWIYGHSHFNQKPLFIGKTILLTNQLGYVHLAEYAKFKHNAYFSI
jgi:Icc-related predicted phosphoesterase